VVLCGLRPPSNRGDGIRLRRQPMRLLTQVSGNFRRPAVRGSASRLIECGGHDGVAPAGSHRKMERPFSRAGDNPSETPVKLAPLISSERVIDRCGEQRVGEPEVIVGRVDNACRYGDVDSCCHVGWAFCRALQQLNVWIRGGGGDRQHPKDVARHSGQPLADELLQGGGYGQGLTRPVRDLTALDRSGELQSE
jgi:hypothetical protein